MSKITAVSEALKLYMDNYEALIKTDSKLHRDENDLQREEKKQEIKVEWKVKRDEIDQYLYSARSENADTIKQKEQAIADIIGLQTDEAADINSIVTIWGAIEQADDEVQGWHDYLSDKQEELAEAFEKYLADDLGNAGNFSAAFPSA